MLDWFRFSSLNALCIVHTIYSAYLCMQLAYLHDVSKSTDFLLSLLIKASKHIYADRKQTQIHISERFNKIFSINTAN